MAEKYNPDVINFFTYCCLLLHRYSLEEAVERLGFEVKVIQIIISIIFDIYEEITLRYPFDYFTIKSMVIQSLEKIVRPRTKAFGLGKNSN